MLVGEAPAGAEMQTGRPFTGGAGVVLSHSLSRSGISMHECFQTNVCHVPAPGNSFSNFYKKENQLALVQGMLQLQADISNIKPNIVVPLGAGALQVITGKKGIDKWRGSILESSLVKGIKSVATYNPAYTLRVYEAKAIMELDFVRVREESRTAEINLPNRVHHLNPPLAERTILRDEMLTSSWLSVDIECWLDNTGIWRLACVGFSDRPDRSLVIPANSTSALLDIRILCESSVPKVFQNGQFDTAVLRDNGIQVKNYAWDTMYGHHALFVEAAGGGDEMSVLQGKKKMSVFKKGLGFQTSIYTREPFYKDDGKLWKDDGNLEMFWLYNGRDAAVTMEIRNVQELELDSFGTRCVLDHEMALVHPLIYATQRGILIDKAKREFLRTEYNLQIERLQYFLDAGAGKPVNVKSPDMKWLLYELLKLPPKMKKRKKADGTYASTITADKDAVNELAGKYKNPLLLTILRIRELRDYLERYIDVPVGADGRMRSLSDPSGTRSGRLAYRKGLDGTGTNLQTIPSRKAVGEQIRQMFISDPGKLFIYPDYKQAEAWVVAYLARCEGLIELLNDPTRDVHYENAARIFNKQVSEVTKEERYLAKRVVHASNYGMGPDRLVELVAEDSETSGVRINKQQASQLMAKYFFVYPEIKTIFWADVEREVRHTRILNTPFGRKRAFYARMDDKLIREAYSYIPQSTVGDLGGKAAIRVYNEVQLGMPELGAEFLLNVHDSILVQCNENKYRETADAVLTAMSIPIVVHGRTFIVPTDCKIGRNWGNLSDSNPSGMRDMDKTLEGLNLG